MLLPCHSLVPALAPDIKLVRRMDPMTLSSLVPDVLVSTLGMHLCVIYNQMYLYVRVFKYIYIYIYIYGSCRCGT